MVAEAGLRQEHRIGTDPAVVSNDNRIGRQVLFEILHRMIGADDLDARRHDHVRTEVNAVVGLNELARGIAGKRRVRLQPDLIDADHLGRPMHQPWDIPVDPQDALHEEVEQGIAL